MADPEVNDKWQFISQNGFPALVAGWFMLRMEKRIEKLFQIVYRIAGKVGVSDKDEGGDA